MNLHIDTATNPVVKVFLEKEGREIDRIEIEAKYQQAEKILLTIEQLISNNDLLISDIKNIFVEEKGDSFSALRIGILTANALSFALGIPINGKAGLADSEQGIEIARPKYDRAPNITIPVKR